MCYKHGSVDGIKGDVCNFQTHTLCYATAENYGRNAVLLNFLAFSLWFNPSF